MRSEPDTVGTATVAARRAFESASAAIEPLSAFPAVQGDAARAAASPTPLWICLCGARNRLRDTACRNCGTGKP